MSYTPWPIDGCTLGEARERTADRAKWQQWRSGITNIKSWGPGPSFVDGDPLEIVRDDSRMRRRHREAINERENKINADFRQHMRNRRLIAFGRLRDLTAQPQLIASDIWPALTRTNWQDSAVGEGRREGTFFLAVKVYPAILAPCAAEMVAGHSLSNAFTKFVMEDPEVATLAQQALQFDGAARPMLGEGKFGRGVTFEWQWPIDLSPYPKLGNVINGAHSFYEKAVVVGDKSHDACDALRDRYMNLLALLKRGAIVARGTHAQRGQVQEIDVALWSRPSAWIDIRNGDFLEETGDGKLVPRWIGLSFVRAAPSTTDSVPMHGDGQRFGTISSTAQTSSLFHVEPRVPGGVPSAIMEPKPASTKKSIAGAAARNTARKACTAWLEGIMGASPNARTESKPSLWKKAQQKWPGTLSERAFIAAWADAVSHSGAVVWSAAGAPTKPKRK